jgi:hypothetical protein
VALVLLELQALLTQAVAAVAEVKVLMVLQVALVFAELPIGLKEKIND